jgi:hypothetical protein
MSKLALAEEKKPSDEGQHIESLRIRLLKKIADDAGDGRMHRDVHVKMHCLVKAEFIVEPNLPEAFRIGVFAKPRTYKALIRFSNSDGSIKPDRKPDIRGMAIKLLDVPGTKLLKDEEHEKTQDFILISCPVFPAADVKKFDGIVAAILGGVWAKLRFFITNPRVIWILAKTMKKFANPLQIRYFSTTPYRFGTHAVKYSATPLFATPDRIPDAPSDDYLRLAIVNQLQNGEAIFDFGVQLQTDAEAMPVEDPRVEWPETMSPFRKLATIRILQQDCDSTQQAIYGDNLSFTPWHALPEHRPLGGINRARKVIYEAISRRRHEHNREPRKEPVDWEW